MSKYRFLSLHLLLFLAHDAFALSPKTFLFGERGPGRCNPTKEMSFMTSPCCQEGGIVPQWTKTAKYEDHIVAPIVVSLPAQCVGRRAKATI